MKLVSANPASVRMRSTLVGSLSENGSSPLDGDVRFQPVRRKALLNRVRPLVCCVVPPNHHDQTSAGYECPADVAKRCDRMPEEHRAVPADRNIEVSRR